MTKETRRYTCIAEQRRFWRVPNEARAWNKAPHEKHTVLLVPVLDRQDERGKVEELIRLKCSPIGGPEHKRELLVARSWARGRRPDGRRTRMGPRREAGLVKILQLTAHFGWAGTLERRAVNIQVAGVAS